MTLFSPNPTTTEHFWMLLCVGDTSKMISHLESLSFQEQQDILQSRQSTTGRTPFLYSLGLQDLSLTQYLLDKNLQNNWLDADFEGNNALMWLTKHLKTPHTSHTKAKEHIIDMSFFESFLEIIPLDKEQLFLQQNTNGQNFMGLFLNYDIWPKSIFKLLDKISSRAVIHSYGTQIGIHLAH